MFSFIAGDGCCRLCSSAKIKIMHKFFLIKKSVIFRYVLAANMIHNLVLFYFCVFDPFCVLTHRKMLKNCFFVCVASASISFTDNLFWSKDMMKIRFGFLWFLLFCLCFIWLVGFCCCCFFILEWRLIYKNKVLVQTLKFHFGHCDGLQINVNKILKIFFSNGYSS